MTQPLLERDPGSAFLASGDPARFLTDNLPATEDAPDLQHRNALVLIAGAFLAWRMWVIAHREELPAPPSDPHATLARFWLRHQPIWMKLAAPAVLEIMNGAGLVGQEREAVAADYAAKLGDYIHSTSAQAVVDGYSEQLKRGVSPTLSWLRAMEGYGLESRQLRSWVAQQAGAALSHDLVPEGAKRALDRALLVRADLLGDTEAWHARHVAKSVAWMYAQARGELTGDVRKRWITAADELVCKICGPLHRKQVRLTERFVLPDGRKLWAPGVHPNCRCELILVYPTVVVEKAVPGDPYDRDRRGRFAPQEARRRVVPIRMPVKDREPVDPAVAEMLAQMDQPSLLDERVPSLLDDGPAPSLLGDTPSLIGDTPSLLDDTPSLFGDTPSLFGGAPSLLSNTLSLGRKRRRRTVWLLLEDGSRVEVNTEDVLPDDDRMVFLPMDEYFAYPRYDEYGTELDLRDRNGKPRGMGTPYVGQVFDFDALARDIAYRADQRGEGPAKLPRAWVMTPGDNPNKILHMLEPFYGSTDEIASLQELYAEQYSETEASYYQQAMDNPEGFVQSLSTDQVMEIARATTGGKHLGPYDTRQFVISAMSADPDVSENDVEEVSSMVYEHVVNETEELDALRMIMDRADELGTFFQTPYVFTFADGDIGGIWEQEGTDLVPRVTGKYVVREIKTHQTVTPQMRQNIGRPLYGMDRVNPKIRAWKEVVLERVDPERME